MSFRQRAKEASAMRSKRILFSVTAIVSAVATAVKAARATETASSESGVNRIYDGQHRSSGSRGRSYSSKRMDGLRRTEFRFFNLCDATADSTAVPIPLARYPTLTVWMRDRLVRYEQIMSLPHARDIDAVTVGASRIQNLRHTSQGSGSRYRQTYEDPHPRRERMVPQIQSNTLGQSLYVIKDLHGRAIESWTSIRHSCSRSLQRPET